jgi:hypothetical protein
MLLPDIVDVDATRPSRDGGRDAIGRMKIGRGPSTVQVDFALETTDDAVSPSDENAYRRGKSIVLTICLLIAGASKREAV